MPTRRLALPKEVWAIPIGKLTNENIIEWLMLRNAPYNEKHGYPLKQNGGATELEHVIGIPRALTRQLAASMQRAGFQVRWLIMKNDELVPWTPAWYKAKSDNRMAKHVSRAGVKLRKPPTRAFIRGARKSNKK